MPVEELLEEVGIVVQAGRNVIDATALFNDIGNHVGYAVQETIHLTNGTAQQLTVLTAGAGATVTTGFGLLAVEVGTFVAAIAPALGILAGVGLYNLAPDFWTRLNNKLVAAGLTIGNKVFGLVDSTGVTHFPLESIEIFKDEIIGVMTFTPAIQEVQGLPQEIDEELDVPAANFSNLCAPIYKTFFMVGQLKKVAEIFKSLNPDSILTENILFNANPYIEEFDRSVDNANLALVYFHQRNATTLYLYLLKFVQQTYKLTKKEHEGEDDGVAYKFGISTVNPIPTVASKVISFDVLTGNISFPEITVHGFFSDWVMELLELSEHVNNYNWDTAVFSSTVTFPNEVQDNATFPTEAPIPVTYPTWVPLEAPLCDPTQSTEPGVDPPTIATPVYPIEVPYVTPAPLQQPAQNPQPQEFPDPYRRWIIETTPIPTPYEKPTPSPIPSGDPDPNNDSLPAPDNPAVPDSQPAPDPPNPNVPLEPNLEPLIPPVLDTFPSSTLFTVYNPTNSQLDSLGNYLWSGEIIDIIAKIWQNPLSAIISLHRVYKAPTVSAAQTIRLGMLDSEVPAAVVSEQFRRFSCGSVLIKEQNKNVTDYSPYASVHIYLPFIGIVPLDVDEVMGGTIEVVYSVDMYTGACLAEVRLTRQPDVPVQKILYTFNGTASQSMPLTSADATGLVSSIAGLGAAAIGVVSGGGALGGAAIAAHSLTHELLHVGHSGSLSANAGIMGQRIPFVIIGRRFGYDANAYGQIYGYPTNKTVYLGNCDGFTRVIAIQLKTEATQAEKNEIEALLKDGVIF